MKSFLLISLFSSIAVLGCRTSSSDLEEGMVMANSLRVSSSSGYVSENDRNTYLKNATLFVGRVGQFPTPQELVAGPETGKNPIADNQTNYCHYIKRTNRGTNPKFRCFMADANGNYIGTKGEVIPKRRVRRIGSKEELLDRSGQKLAKADEIKVKYFPSERARRSVRIYRRNPFGRYKDRYTEVVATRLMWAMGFPADRMWPTEKVRCFDCAQEPFHAPSRRIEDQVDFEDAAIERKYPGKKMESRSTEKGQGWNWNEVSETAMSYWQGTDRFDHLEGLMVFLTILNHVSNRPEQQRLICDKKSIDELGVCQSPILMVQDIGSTFGHRKIVRVNGRRERQKSKGSLKNWSEHRVWMDDGSCTLNLNFYSDHSSTFRNFKVHRGGLDFIKERLSHLTPEHLTSLMTYAKFQRTDLDLEKKLQQNLGRQDVSREAIQAWVDAFMDKVRQVTSKECT